MQEVGSGTFAETEASGAAERGSGETPGIDADALELLERRVETAATLIQTLRGERDALQESLEERDARIETLEETAGKAAGNDEEVRRLRTERDKLLTDRSAASHRVEGILARLDKLGLDG